MPAIHVCSLSRLARVVETHGASHVVSLINDGTDVARPQSILPDRHLFLGMNDIVEPIDGMVLPSQKHVEDFIAFVESWDRGQPMVIHCWAGISRSTAGAFIAACALTPASDEEEIARKIREASATATPNARLVEIADAILGRGGRMSSAVAAIGRGTFAYEGTPFSIHIGPRSG